MKVSWDDDIPNIWKVIKAMSQTTNQFFILSFYHLMFFYRSFSQYEAQTPQLHNRAPV